MWQCSHQIPNKCRSVIWTNANINIIIHGAVLKYNLAKILKVIEVIFSFVKQIDYMTRVKLKEQYISYLSLLQTFNNISVIMLLHTFNIISPILDVRRGDYVIPCGTNKSSFINGLKVISMTINSIRGKKLEIVVYFKSEALISYCNNLWPALLCTQRTNT